MHVACVEWKLFRFLLTCGITKFFYYWHAYAFKNSHVYFIRKQRYFVVQFKQTLDFIIIRSAKKNTNRQLICKFAKLIENR